MQEYFGGKVASEITLDTVCYGVFLCSWNEEVSLTRVYKGESEPRCSEIEDGVCRNPGHRIPNSMGHGWIIPSTGPV